MPRAWCAAALLRRGGEGCGRLGGVRPPSRPPPSFTRVCGAAAASRQGKMAVLHEAALYGHACCVESLLKAGANASLKNEVSGGAEGRGGKRLGSGRGTERVWGRGLVQASRRLSAPPCPRPLPSSPGCLYPPLPPPPSPCRSGARRLWTSPSRKTTRRPSGSWRTPPPSHRAQSDRADA